MKSLKQIIKETVAEPKSPDEKRFKELHTKNVDKKDYPVDSGKSERVTKKKPRKADYTDGSDEKAYDTSYESVSFEDLLVIDEDMLEEALEDLSEEQLDEIIKTAVKAVGIGTSGAKAVKSVAGKVKNRFSASGRADALKRRTDAIRKRKEDQNKLKTARTDYNKSRKEEVELDENAWEEIPMMERQLKFIAYASEEMIDYLVECDTDCVDPEEWFQNKLAHIHGQMRTLHAYVEGDRRMGDMGGMYEETDLTENTIKDLEKIVKTKSRGEIKFKDGDSIKVDMQTANVLVKVYDALNDPNKKKFEDALGKNETMFMKMVDFAWSKVK